MTSGHIDTVGIEVPGVGHTDLEINEFGDGRPVLLLHGGGGTATVTAFAAQWAQREAGEVRIIVPIHPGFDGTPRPAQLGDVPSLAVLYVALLDTLGLEDVTVVGNSLGGWIAAEMATLGSPRVSRYVLVDAAGIEVTDHPPADLSSLTPREVAEHCYHQPDRFTIDPTQLPQDALQRMASNRETMLVYAGSAKPGLRQRLGTIETPVLVIWGESDRLLVPDYGRAYAESIPGARFELLGEAGHLPQLETPDALIDAVADFLRT